MFAKPAAEGSSMGITERSLCRNQEELDKAIDRLKKYGPVLVEEFLPGDEFTVGIIGGEVLGVMQVLPRGDDKDFIYSLDVKRDYLNRVVERVPQLYIKARAEIHRPVRPDEDVQHAGTFIRRAPDRWSVPIR